MKKKIILVYWLVLIYGIILYVFLNYKYFTRRFDPVYSGALYSQSQYVIGELSKGGIGDDGLYSFAGYYYLLQKGDVSSVNFEHPPLGKYLIGVSIYLFGNENVINLIYYSLILFITFRLSSLFYSDKLYSLISISLVAVNPFFLDHLKRSLLDLPFTLAFITAVYFYILSFKKSNLIFASFVFWGSTLSIKFFPAFILLYPFLFIVWFKYHRQQLKKFILGSLLLPIMYLLIHTSYFVYHPSFVEFLRHKKWMIDWWRGSPILPGNILRSLFTGNYIDSVGKIAREEHWNLLIPSVTILCLSGIANIFTDFKSIKFTVLYGIIAIYLLYLIFFGGGILKFIMPIYPLLAILAVKNIENLYSIIGQWMKLKLRFLRAK